MAVPSERTSSSFYHPRYWMVWMVYGLLRLLILLPYPVQMFLGRRLGPLLIILAKKRRRIAEINIKLCFPEWSDEKRNVLLQRHVESLGVFPFESAMACWWPDSRIHKLVHFEGLENLEKALDNNKGVIILAAHFTTIVMTSRLLRMNHEVCAMYRRLDNALAEHMFKRAGERVNVKLIRHNDLRGMLGSLRENKPVIYIPDQNFGIRHSEFVPFFGISAATLTAISRLASISNSPVVPVMQQRLSGNKGYRLVLQEALDNFPGNDIKQDLLRINQLVEQQVRDVPSEYLWIHRRFKTRPQGEESLYKLK